MKHHYKTISYTCILMLSFMSVPAHSVDYNDYPELREMVAEMVAEDGYPQDELVAVLAAASIDDGVIRSMDRQYEALPWHQYRRRFVTDARIAEGVKWWDLHAETLGLGNAEIRRAGGGYGGVNRRGNQLRQTARRQAGAGFFGDFDGGVSRVAARFSAANCAPSSTPPAAKKSPPNRCAAHSPARSESRNLCRPVTKPTRSI